MKTTLLRALPVLAEALSAAAVTAATAVSGVSAIVWGGADGRFSRRRVTLLLEALQQAQIAPGEPQAVDWRNAASAAGCTLLGLGAAQHKDFAECRRVSATVFSKRIQGHPAVWTECKDPKDPKGRWALVSAG